MTDEYDSYDLQDVPDYYGGDYGSPVDLGGGENDTAVISDDDYDFQGGTNPITGLPVGSGEVGYSSDSGGALTQLAKALGLTGKDGSPSLAKLLGLVGVASSLRGAGSAGTVKTPAELLASIPSNTPPTWSAEQVGAMQVPLKAGNQLARQYAADMPTPIRPGQGYAEGGEVAGPLSAMFDSSQGDAFVQGPGDGQSDSVDAKLARGEYVFDAETVSMLGNGDNVEIVVAVGGG